MDAYAAGAGGTAGGVKLCAVPGWHSHSGKEKAIAIAIVLFATTCERTAQAQGACTAAQQGPPVPRLFTRSTRSRGGTYGSESVACQHECWLRPGWGVRHNGSGGAAAKDKLLRTWLSLVLGFPGEVQ